MKLKKITAYTIYTNPEEKYFWVRLRLEENDQDIADISLPSLAEMQALVDLLRNESRVWYDTETNNIVVGWEPVGENAPKE